MNLLVLLPAALALVLVLSEVPHWVRESRLPPAGADDASTAHLITRAGWCGAFLALAFACVAPWPHLSAAVRWNGAVVLCSGIALRQWAVAALGQHFTLTLRAHPHQAVVLRGPYRWVRHPAYLGGELALIGLGMAMGNGASTVALWLPMCVAHLRRIRVEEALLTRVLGRPYEQYCQRSWKLVPWVY